MLICRSIRLFGTNEARQNAQAILENMQQVRRIDSKNDLLRLLVTMPVTEMEFLSALEKSGISGFSLYWCPSFIHLLKRVYHLLFGKAYRIHQKQVCLVCCQYT